MEVCCIEGRAKWIRVWSLMDIKERMDLLQSNQERKADYSWKYLIKECKGTWRIMLAWMLNRKWQRASIHRQHRRSKWTVLVIRWASTIMNQTYHLVLSKLLSLRSNLKRQTFNKTCLTIQSSLHMSHLNSRSKIHQVYLSIKSLLRINWPQQPIVALKRNK